MARKELIRHSYHPYHVTMRSNNKEWFYIESQIMWKILNEHLFTTHYVYMARIHAVVLMSNHFHLLISTPESNLDQIMLYLARETAKSINRQTGRINRIFGGRYKWSLITHHTYFFNVLRYIYQNPIRAGICDQIQKYPYSSLHGLLGLSSITLPVHYPEIVKDIKLLNDLQNFTSWVNTPLETSQVEIIKKGIRRSTFKYPTRTSSKLKRDLYDLSL